MHSKNEELKQREKLIQAFELFNHILTTNQKQIFHLYYIEDLSLSEIANIVATTRSSVHDTLTKATKKLKPFLTNIEMD